MNRRSARPGLTLTEVLVAMFVMALGMIALLTLFPLGAMQIGDALRMDRATQTASSADSVLRMHWRHQVQTPMTMNGRPADPLIWDAMDDPNLLQHFPDPPASPAGIGTGSNFWLYQFVPQTVRLSGGILPSGWGNSYNAPNPVLPVSSTQLTQDIGNDSARITNPGNNMPPYMQPTAYGEPRGIQPNPFRLPSFPMMIDPIGAIGRQTASGEFWVSGSASLQGGTIPLYPTPLANYDRFLIPRRVPGFCFVGTSKSSAVTSNFFVMSDDYAFEPNGAPDPVGPVPLMNRQGRYNWAAILQRPQFENRLVADLKIMVFDGRAPGATGPEDELVVSTSWTNVSGDPTQPVTAAPLYLTVGQKSVALLLPARSATSPALLRRGGWIMDGTIHVDEIAGLTGQRSVRNANFYRITGLQAGDEGAGPFITLPSGGQMATTAYLVDLETPIKGPTTSATYAAPYTRPESPAQIYLFANLTEVFERPALRSDVQQGN